MSTPIYIQQLWMSDSTVEILHALVSKEKVYFSLLVPLSFEYSWWASQDCDEQYTAQIYL